MSQIRRWAVLLFLCLWRQGRCGAPAFRIGHCRFKRLTFAVGFDMIPEVWETMRLEGVPLVPLLNMNSSIKVEIIPWDTKCNPTESSKAGIAFANMEVNVVLGCTCSSASEVMARFGAWLEIPQISYISSAMVFSRQPEIYPYFMRTIAPLRGVHKATVVFMAAVGWRSGKYFHSSDPYAQLADEDLVTETVQFAENFNITVYPVPLPVDPAQADPIPPNGGVCPQSTRLTNDGACRDVTLWREQVHKSREFPTVIHIIRSTLTTTAVVLTLAFEMGLMKHPWFFPNEGSRGWPELKDLMLHLQGGVALWGPPIVGSGSRGFVDYWNHAVQANYQDYENKLEPDVFAKLVSIKDSEGWPSPASPYMAYWNYVVDAVSTVYLALDKLLGEGYSVDRAKGKVLRDAMLGVAFDGMMGRVTFDGKGDPSLLHPLSVTNFQNGEELVVAHLVDGSVVFTGNPVVWPGNSSVPPSSEFPECPRGSYYDGLACAGCGDGYELASGSTRCQACKLGTAGTNLCNACEPGYFANTSGLSRCHICPPGLSCSVDGVQDPSPCAAGTFSEGEGNVVCLSCAAGKYSDQKARTACLGCAPAGAARPDLWKTLQRLEGVEEWVPFAGATAATDCGCQVGAFLVDGDCVPCREGLDCLGMGEVKLAQGYSSSLDDKLSIFKCHDNPRRCPGGPLGTCAEGREGVQCTFCMEGWTASADGKCRPCSGEDSSLIGVCIVVFVAAVIALYVGIASQGHMKQLQSKAVIAIAGGQLVTLAQTLSMVGLMLLRFPEPLASLIKLVQLLNFNIEILRADCVVKLSPLSLYSSKILAVACLLAIMLLLFVLDVLIRHKRRFREHADSLCCALGTILMAFFISISSTVFAPLQCSVSHPNGASTLRGFPTVVCWESSDHAPMIGIGAVAASVPIGFLSAATWMVLQFPRRMRLGDTSFLAAWSFLLFRFRSGAQWYSLAFLWRGLLVSLVPLFPDIATQICTMWCILLFSFFLGVHVKPWRVWQVNALDTVMLAGIMFLISMSSLFTEEDVDRGAVATLCFVILLMVIVVIILTKLFSLYKRLAQCSSDKRPFSRFLCHHKAGAGSLARLLKMTLSGAKGISGKVFVDSDDLTDLDKLFDYVGSQSQVLVVLCSAEILTRPWCMGEIVTGKANRVTTVKVILPDFVERDDDDIEQYRTLVPDLSGLAERGISLAMIQDMLRWLRTCPQVKLPEAWSMRVVRDLSSHLGSLSWPGQNVDISFQEDPICVSTCKAPILTDHRNAEAMATAFILASLLKGLFSAKPEDIPQVLPAGEGLPVSTRVLLVICTNGVFQQADTLRALRTAAELNTGHVPILADDAFRFPTPAFLEEHLAVAALVSESPGQILQLIKDIFVEIAIVFQPSLYSSTERILAMKAEEVGQRLGSKDTLRGLSLKDHKSLDANVLDILARKDSMVLNGTYGEVDDETHYEI